MSIKQVFEKQSDGHVEVCLCLLFSLDNFEILFSVEPLYKLLWNIFDCDLWMYTCTRKKKNDDQICRPL